MNMDDEFKEIIDLMKERFQSISWYLLATRVIEEITHRSDLDPHEIVFDMTNIQRSCLDSTHYATMQTKDRIESDDNTRWEKSE